MPSLGAFLSRGGARSAAADRNSLTKPNGLMNTFVSLLKYTRHLHRVPRAGFLNARPAHAGVAITHPNSIEEGDLCRPSRTRAFPPSAR
jgi:hypothetical protein